MQINVSQLLKAPIGSTREYEVDEAIDIEGNNSSLCGKFSIMRTPKGILARGTVDTETELTCSRCLSPFKYPLSLTIEEEYFPTNDIISGTPLPMPEEPEAFTIDEHNILDLAEAIRQYTVLAVPMKPLCNKECAGLCPNCGMNLNQASCDCPSKPADPHWEKLANRF